VDLVSHVADLGYDASDGRWHPTCSCGQTFTVTRWASAAIVDTNRHLTAVGAKTIPGERARRARRYLGSGTPA
jgi:hypothetical protein